MTQHVMVAQDAVALLGRLSSHEVEVCVGGGWGVDALLMEQTREHSDLDVWAPAVQLERIFVALAEGGIDRIFPWPKGKIRSMPPSARATKIRSSCTAGAQTSRSECSRVCSISSASTPQPPPTHTSTS